MTVALVPVKRLAAGKSRLAGALGRSGAERVALAMLEDVLEALRAVSRLNTVAVVTPDTDVARVAERAGATAWVRADPGLNPSIDAAAEALAPAGDGAVLVMLGDVAGALPEDIETLLDARPNAGVGPSAVLAAARDGGSTALLRIPWNAFPSHFGPESAAAHRAAAEQHGVPLAEPTLPSLQLDLDSEADLKDFLALPRGGSRTRQALRALGYGG